MKGLSGRTAIVTGGSSGIGQAIAIRLGQEGVHVAVNYVGPVEGAEVTMSPKQTVEVGEDKAAALLRLLEYIEEDEDVQAVYANFDIPADVLERVSASV